MINAEQRKLRAKMLGSSEAPAIMGLDPYQNAMDVYLIKTGRADPFDGNANTERGNILEAPLLDWLEGQLNITLERNVFIAHANGLLCANLDARGEIEGRKIIAEAKTSVLTENWGDSGTDQIPEGPMIQVHHQMAVSGIEFGYVAVLLPAFRKFDFRLYPIECNRELRDYVAEQGVNFMDRYVRRDTPPPAVMASLDVLKRMKRVPVKSVQVDDSLAMDFLNAKAAAKQAGEWVEKSQRALLAALGDADGATYSDGSFTYLESNRRSYTVEATTFRALRHKAAK